MHLAPAGDRALLADLGDVTAEELHAAKLRAQQIEGVQAVIPGHHTLLLVFENEPDPNALHQLTTDYRLPTTASKTHHLRVSFSNAPDLQEFLTLTNQSLDHFLHHLPRLRARYLGFRAGFAYLDGWPPEWSMPRRPTSRPVPRGSFAIAGSVAGFYPLDTPGGWNLLGQTDAVLWDDTRTPPNLIAAGDEIIIEPALTWPLARPVLSRERERTAAKRQVRGGLSATQDFDVIAAPLVTIVTAPDWRRLDTGVAEGGPFDDVAAALAMAAVRASEALECALVGPRLRMRRARFASWYGATADITVNGRRIDDPRFFRVQANEEIAIGPLRDGLRGYLAFGADEGLVATFDRADRLTIGIMQGPHDCPFDELECVVTNKLDRVGIRLAPSRTLSAPADLPSIGVQTGTLQLHPDGSVIAMGPDHPVTGGYLQPATVVTSERWKLAQLRPGDRVTFIPRMRNRSEPSP